MSLFKNSQRALAILGLVGLAAASSTTQASAFGGFGGGHFGGGGFGGGHFGGGGFGGGFGGGRFGGGGFGGGGFGGGRFTGIGFGGHRPMGDRSWGRHPMGDEGRFPHPRPGRWPIRNPIDCTDTHSCGPRPPIGRCNWTHSCGPVQVGCRFHPWSPFCRPRGLPPVTIPVGYPRPVYVPPTPTYSAAPTYAATAPSYSPPAPTYSSPAAAPAPVYTPPAPACVKDPTIWIVFQPTVTAADITAFLKAYNVTMENGPDPSAVYRLRVNEVPQEQLGQLMDSMRTQTNVVSQVGA